MIRLVALTIAMFSLFGAKLQAQQLANRTEVDTIAVYVDKVFVEYSVYSDDVLFEKTEAYFYPVVLERPRFNMLPNMFKIEIQADSIVFHGDRTTYLSNRDYKTEKHEQGRLLSTTYFNREGEEITAAAYQKNNLVRGPCGQITGHYFIHGKK